MGARGKKGEVSEVSVLPLWDRQGRELCLPLEKVEPGRKAVTLFGDEPTLQGAKKAGSTQKIAPGPEQPTKS